MIATIAEKKKSSAMVVAAIAGEWFPYDRCDRWFFFLSDRSDHSDHMDTKPYFDKSMKRFAAS